MSKTMKKLLIVNRGEIAVRIIRSARALGIKTVSVYSQLDDGAYYTRLADESYLMEGDSLAETYLNIEQLLSIAEAQNCDALHPGYGFLSENPELAIQCKKREISYVGPTPEVIHCMGNKLEARSLVKTLGVPLLEGIEGSHEELLAQQHKLTYPILVKAASGGGGKGMRIVDKPEDLPAALETTSREALASFADATVYIETYLKNPRHIEIQILADNHGNVIHLGERECSIQRRHQKIVEESPSPAVSDAVRERMGTEAVKIAQSINYQNAGTIEFLMDEQQNFYFLEMNTRIQVEHPITELVYGVDLIKEQLHIAMGNPLDIRQEDVTPKGHALECRIYAEDPQADFRPSPGKITLYKEAEGPWIRNDSSIKEACTISPLFDPMISKLIVWGRTRTDAILRMQSALEESVIQGISTNISYLREVMEVPEFRSGDYSTSFCEVHKEQLMNRLDTVKSDADEAIPLIAHAIFKMSQQPETTGTEAKASNPFQQLGAWRV